MPRRMSVDDPEPPKSFSEYQRRFWTIGPASNVEGYHELDVNRGADDSNARDGDVDVQMEDALISGTPIRCDIPDDSGKA